MLQSRAVNLCNSAHHRRSTVTNTLRQTDFKSKQQLEESAMASASSPFRFTFSSFTDNSVNILIGLNIVEKLAYGKILLIILVSAS